MKEDFWLYHDELQASKVVNTDENGSLEFVLYLNAPPNSKNKCAIKYWPQQLKTPFSELALKYV